MAIVGHANSPLFLGDTRFCTEAIGRNDVVQSIGGRARVCYEIASGENPFPSEPPATTRNPQGALGHDHSGPPWGSAFLHPVAWWTWQKVDSTHLQQPSKNPLGPLDDGVPASIGPWVFWNRPHTPLPSELGRAPYSRLFLYFVAHRPSTNASLGVRVSTVDPETGNESAQTDTVTVTSSTPAGFASTAAFVDVTGGRNIIRVQFTAADGNSPTVDAVALCQVVKRLH